MQMRFLPKILALFAALAFCKAIEASPRAFDSAGDSAYSSGWTAGTNGGYGWNGGWDFQYLGTATATLASDPADGGIMNSPASPLGRAWEVTDSKNYVEPAATRHTLTGLQPGQVLSVDVDYSSADMIFGFADDHSDYTLISIFRFTQNGPSDYLIEQNEQWFSGYQPISYDSQVAAFSGPIHIELTALSIIGSRSNFALEITSLTTGQSATLPSLFLGVDSGPQQPDVDTFYFGATGPSGVFFNNLSITPEPAALATLSIFSLLLLKRRRTRSASKFL